jgi:hypothetical protein
MSRNGIPYRSSGLNGRWRSRITPIVRRFRASINHRAGTALAVAPRAWPFLLK